MVACVAREYCWRNALFTFPLLSGSGYPFSLPTRPCKQTNGLGCVGWNKRLQHYRERLMEHFNSGLTSCCLLPLCTSPCWGDAHRLVKCNRNVIYLYFMLLKTLMSVRDDHTLQTLIYMNCNANIVITSYH